MFGTGQSTDTKRDRDGRDEVNLLRIIQVKDFATKITLKLKSLVVVVIVSLRDCELRFSMLSPSQRRVVQYVLPLNSTRTEV